MKFNLPEPVGNDSALKTGNQKLYSFYLPLYSPFVGELLLDYFAEISKL